MSNRKNLRIKFYKGKMVFVGEIVNTTKTIMAIVDGMKAKGIEFDIEKKGMSLLATTLCG